MSKREIDKKIAEITDKIAKEIKPEKIILFGSYAWGKPHQDSDLDLFVIEKSKLSKRKRQINIRRLFIDFEMSNGVSDKISSGFFSSDPKTYFPVFVM